MERKPGESVQELAARIRHDAGTCDFSSIRDPLDEALRTRFICSIANEAVLKAIFKIKADELTFAKAIEVAMQTEDAAKVAKETAHGSHGPIHKVDYAKSSTSSKPSHSQKKKMNCYRCGKPDHLAPACRHKNAKCGFCKRLGHLETVCRKKRSATETVHSVLSIPSKERKLEVNVHLGNKACLFEVDTATNGNFISVETWKTLGSPELQSSNLGFKSATAHPVPFTGCFQYYCQLRGCVGRSAISRHENATS